MKGLETSKYLQHALCNLIFAEIGENYWKKKEAQRHGGDHEFQTIWEVLKGCITILRIVGCYTDLLECSINLVQCEERKSTYLSARL